MRHGWIAALWLVALGPAGGEDERGAALFEQGQYAEAAAAFRAAIAADGPSAERAYNLALSLWKAGDLDAAETAAEEAATLSDGALNPLRDGLLGNLRYAAAEAAQEQDLQAALALAKQARAHFLRGALAPGARPELGRNLERALQLIDALQKKIEEQEKQEQENKDQKPDEQKQDDQKKDEEKPDEQKPDEQKKAEPKPDEQKPEPKPEGDPAQQPEPQPEPQPEEPKPDPQQQPPQDQKQEQQPEQQQPAPAPGEQQAGRELTQEEKKRLLDKLDELDKLRLELRERQKAQRPKVEKDW